MRRALLTLVALVVVAALYPVVAMQVPPGFYDGICPAVDYKFLNPPPGVRTSGQPASGHAVFKVVNGQVAPGFVATNDDNPQAQLSFVPGAFAVPTDGSNTVTIDIKPVRDFPPTTGLTIATNVYLITSSTAMVKPSNLRLLYSSALPAPSTIYLAPPGGGTWQSLDSSVSSAYACSSVTTQVTSTGLFAAGYAAGGTPAPGAPTIGGGQTLPIVVALAILIVVLAGVPLAVARRRRGSEPPAAGPGNGAAPQSKPPGRRRG